MRQIPMLLTAALVTLASASVFADNSNQPTGFTDGSNNPSSGTKVITGQEAPQSGAVSGAKPHTPPAHNTQVRKHKRHRVKKTTKTETQTESR